MPDEDVRKRCFHCVFTDWKGTDGKMGFITPALLAKLFADPEAASKKLATRRPSNAQYSTASDKSNKESSEGMDIEMKSAVADGEGDSD